MPALGGTRVQRRHPDVRSREEQDALVRANWGLIWHVMRAEGCRADDEDMQSMAAEGLWAAARLFDPSKGWKFSTYAWQAIRAHIWRERRFRNRKRALPPPRRLPRDLRDQVYVAARAEGEILDREARRDLAGELAELLAEIAPLRRYVLLQREAGRTLQSIADEAGYTKEGIRQMYVTAILHLRRAGRRHRSERTEPCHR